MLFVEVICYQNEILRHYFVNKLTSGRGEPSYTPVLLLGWQVQANTDTLKLASNNVN